MARKNVLRRLPRPLQIFVRFIPLLLAIEILGAFLATRPEEAQDLWFRVRQRFGLTTEVVAPATNPLGFINSLRQEKGLKSLVPNQDLNRAARLLAISISNSPENEVSVKEAASAVGYHYQTISYFSLEYTQPLVTPPEENFAKEENKIEILKDVYQEIGFDIITLPDAEKTMVMVVIIAQRAKPAVSQSTPVQQKYYTGVELWAQIQQYRREHGVSEFRQDNLLCTLASIRVNQLIILGTLDDHKGFEPLVNEYRDKGLDYGNLGENILMGYPTAAEAVAAWDSSLGHRALMRDGSYVWGCAAANYDFAVLIAAY